MTITLWEQDLRRLADLLQDAVCQAEPEYRKLIAGLAEKDPTITRQSIEAAIKRWYDEDAKPGRSLLDSAAVASANYQNAHATAERLIAALTSGRETKQAVLAAPGALAGLWQAIAGLAFTLNCGPLRLAYAADFRSENARAAIAARHNQPGGYGTKKAAALAEWDSGRYGDNKDTAAPEIAIKVGLASSTVRRYLKGRRAPGKRRTPGRYSKRPATSGG